MTLRSWITLKIDCSTTIGLVLESMLMPDELTTEEEALLEQWLPFYRSLDGADIPVYGPVDRLIDETPLRKPLFLWARLWGVETEFEYAYMYRVMPQLYH